jgi:hypothetical protein
MGRVSAEDWEHVVTRDLLPFLGFGIDLKPRGAQFPVGSPGLPDGAYEDLSADVGRLGAEGLLVVPPAAWMVDRLRYRCLCMPFGPDDYGVSVRWRSYAGSSACMLALTSRELVAVRSWRRAGPPWGRVSRALYVPRRSIKGVVSQIGSVSLDSAGPQVRIELGSRRIATAASAWLDLVLGQPDPRNAGTRPRQAG